MDRPALQQLLADIAERRIDIVVVYKVDRLTRALADFAKLVELFDGKGVSFVSVTQSFNTTTSMGRLTLNVLLSFARVRARGHGRTDPGQDRRLQEKRHLDGWGRAARLQGRRAASCWSTRSKLRRSDSSFAGTSNLDPCRRCSVTCGSEGSCRDHESSPPGERSVVWLSPMDLSLIC